MELTECIPTDRTAFINTMDFTTFKIYSTNSKNDADRKIKFDILKSFCRANIKTRGETKRIYSYTQTTPLDVGGRLYCGNSIQGLQKDFRGFFMDGITTDIDMRNAHPVILRYICHKNDIECPMLEYYINNREKVLEQFGEDGKTLFLKAVNDDKLNKKCTIQLFKDFDKECKRIQQQLYTLDNYKHIVESVPDSRLYNFLGSAINRILCVYENKILQEVISVINQRQIKICSLMFDGLLIYGDHYADEELLLDIENYVNGKFDGLNMRFAYKPHQTDINMPDDYDEPPVVEIAPDETWEAVSAKFEKTHSKITSIGSFMKEENNQLIPMSRTHLKTAYEHLTYDILVEKDGVATITTKNFIQSWMTNNPNQRVYNSIDCFPDESKCPKDCFNTWRKFDMELMTEWKQDDDAIEMFKKHILILCDNDPAVADYMIKWIAQMIQYPDVKTIQPTLISDEGAGKGNLLFLMGQMMGQSRILETTTPSKEVFGQFNGRMASCFLVNMDELSKKELMGCEGQLKALITNPFLNVNEKGEKPYAMKSYHRFFNTTNSREPITSKKDDRRNLIIRSSDELIGNLDYFEALREKIYDKNAVKSFFEYLKSIPNMEQFNKIPMPKTEYQEDIKQANVCPIELFIKDLTEMNAGADLAEITGKEFYELFNSFKTRCGIVYDVSSVQFGLRLKRLNIDGVSSVKKMNGAVKVLDFAKLARYFKLDAVITGNTNENIVFDKKNILLLKAECDDEDDPEL